MFLVSAGMFATLLYAPASPIPGILPNEFLRNLLMGMAMGLTAIALIYSPWGQRSGAHMNPAVTLTFFRLGKITPWDALFYVLSQFLGGLLGVKVVAAIVGTPFTTKPINYIVTVPGKWGWLAALVAEFLIAFTLMITVLVVSNHKRLASYTGICAGILVATFITFEAPISGMSMNPARTFASALPAQVWTAFWIYYFAPTLAMLLAAEVYLRHPDRPRVLCGKLCPNDKTHCLSPQCCCEHSMTHNL